MTEAQSAWIEWMSQTMRNGARISQEIVLQAAEQQRRFVADAAQRWMEHNARILKITNQAAQEGRSAGSGAHQKVR
jgi:2-polyprenyl-6-methoxyphenol hydroxylase-like FAD-dependent oxidoreductase